MSAHIIDKTGMGLPVFDTMDRAFYGKVEGITFTHQTKETMATHTKRRLEECKCRLPGTVIIDGKPDDQIVYGLFEYWRQEAEKLRSGACSGARTGAEIARELGRAQIKYAQDIGCFGAERIRVTPQPACCPKCQATFIIRVAGQFHCNQCGNQWGGNGAPRLPSRRDLLVR